MAARKEEVFFLFFIFFSFFLPSNKQSNKRIRAKTKTKYDIEERRKIFSKQFIIGYHSVYKYFDLNHTQTDTFFDTMYGGMQIFFS